MDARQATAHFNEGGADCPPKDTAKATNRQKE